MNKMQRFGVMMHIIVCKMMGESFDVCRQEKIHCMWKTEKKNRTPKPKSSSISVCVSLHRSTAMIYALIEFHLTGIDFFSNGKY